MSLVKLGSSLVVNPDEVSHYFEYVHEPDQDPDRQKFLGNLLGSAGHRSQIGFKGGAVLWTSLTVAEISEKLGVE